MYHPNKARDIHVMFGSSRIRRPAPENGDFVQQLLLLQL